MPGRHIPSGVFAASLVIALGSNCLLAQPFFFRKDIPVDHAVGIVAGDFNGDGRPDLAVVGDGLFVLLNEAAENLARPIRNDIGVQAGSLVFVSDFNRDGKDDLVTNRGLLLLSRGDGTFLPPRTVVDVARQGAVLGTADFNGDGNADLVVGGDLSAPNGEVRVWLGNGDGTFRPGAMLATLAADAANAGQHVSDRVRDEAVVADFNRDGRMDVALLPLASPLIPLLVQLGQGDGTFAPPIRTQLDAMGLLVADFDGDGLPDLATTGCALCAKGTTGIALGRGDGSFQAPVSYPFSLEALPMPRIAADFTGDGKADLVVVNGNGRTNSFLIYPGKGDGTFLPAVEQVAGWVPHTMTAVDLDADGQRDLAIVNFGSNTLSILLARVEDGPGLRRALSSASDTAIVAPESLATLFAPTSATAGVSASPPWPTQLGGISLEVCDSAGAARLAPLLYVSPTQINFQVPAGTALGEATLAITGERGTTQVGSMRLDAVAPGLFLIDHTVPAATGVRVEPDGTQIPLAVFSCSGTSCKLEPIPLTAAGDRPIYLSFYGTGFRGANADNVTCSLGTVTYAGSHGTPGLDQINVRLSPELVGEIAEYGGGPVSVTIWINGVPANATVVDLR